MCGIVAYIGHREACPIILKGLHRLEYRGYDSAGVALLNGELTVYKKKGKVSDLEAFIHFSARAGVLRGRSAEPLRLQRQPLSARPDGC